MPKISIITPTYKGSKYIVETIESVQKQSFSDYEHIIINDNSPDNVGEIIVSYQSHDKRIIYIENDKNLGIARSRNKGIEVAKGQYLCFLDHDDIFLDKDKLQKQYNFLQENPDYGLVSSNVITIDGHGKELYKTINRQTDHDIRSHFLQSNQFLPCAMMIRKSALDQFGGFDSKYDKSDDYDLWMKIGRQWKMYCLQEYMAGYRVHGNNASASLKSLYHMRILAWKIFWKNRSYYPNFWMALFMRCIEFILLPKRVDFILRLKK